MIQPPSVNPGEKSVCVSLTEGYVYLISQDYPKATIDGNEAFLVKIGFSKNDVHKRLQKLQTGNPFELRWLGHVHLENYKKVEKELHVRFAHRHFRLEWFILTRGDIADLMEEIGLTVIE